MSASSCPAPKARTPRRYQHTKWAKSLCWGKTGLETLPCFAQNHRFSKEQKELWSKITEMKTMLLKRKQLGTQVTQSFLTASYGSIAVTHQKKWAIQHQVLSLGIVQVGHCYSSLVLYTHLSLWNIYLLKIQCLNTSQKWSSRVKCGNSDYNHVCFREQTWQESQSDWQD